MADAIINLSEAPPEFSGTPEQAIAVLSAWTDPDYLIGEVRRFGEAGPAYEVVAIVNDKTVRVRVFATGEEVEVSMMEVCRHPLAETIP